MEEARHHSPEISMQNTYIISTGEAALWGRLFEPTSAALSQEVARYILTLDFPQSDIERMQELAEKAREGTLTLEEHVELDNYERVGHVLSLMKSKARQALKKARPAKRA
jgi:hypothetical protein